MDIALEEKMEQEQTPNSVAEPTIESAPPTLTLTPDDPPKKSRRTLWLILGGVIVGGILLIAVCAILGITAIGQLGTAKGNVEQVVDEFMRDMEAKDIEKAYLLFSPRSLRQTSKEDLVKMIQGNNYILFSGYSSISVANINLRATVQTDPNLPQGTVAQVNGIVKYKGNFEGTFTSVLEQDNGQWRLFNIYITVPPDKFNASSQ